MPALSDCHLMVLAAGRGTRMGGPKALRSLPESPWWREQQARLSRVPCPATWVVSEPVRAALSTSEGAPERVVSAEDGLPMFESILTGLSHIECHERPHPAGVFILPIDTPAPGPDTWARLADTGVVAAPSYNGEHGHPVFLPWDWAVGNALRRPHQGRIESPLRLDRLIAPIIRYIPVNDPDVTVDLDTPEDLHAFIDRNQQHRPRNAGPGPTLPPR